MNTVRRWAVVSVALAICLSGAVVPGWGQTGQKQSVKLKYPPGVYRLLLTSVSNGSTIIEDQEDKSLDEDRMAWRFTVAAPDAQGDKTAVLKLTGVLEKSDGQEIWNSDQPDKGQPAMAFLYKPIMAADVQVVFDADEALVEVAGLDKVMSEISDAAKTDEEKFAVAEHSTFGDKFIERQFRTMESIMPRNAVALGDTWQAGLRLELPVVGEIRTRFDCVAKAIQDGWIVVVATGVHELSRPRQVTVQGQRVTVTKLAVKDDITLTVDIASGRVLTMTTVSKGDILMTAKDENDADVHVVVKADTKNTLAMVVERAEPARQNVSNAPVPTASTPPVQKSAGKSDTAVTYSTYRYIDQGGLRDPQTGQWLEGFRILVPQEWKFTGGFRWIANEKPANMLSKTDLLNPVKSDYAVTSPDGRSVFRQYPVEYWVQSGMFQPGQNYNGMIVCATMTPEQYITQFVVPRQRGVQAADMRIVKQGPLNELAEKYEVESQQLSSLLGSTSSALSFKAGMVTIEYTENGVAYREQFTCILQYLQTAGMVMWWQRMNFSVRSPREQFEAQLPVFTTMALSVQTNPYWSIALIQLRDKVTYSMAQAEAYANKVRNEIAAAHAQTNHELARDGGYLSGDYYDYKGTDGNRYNLPTDKYHFMNQGGDLLSQDDSVPPSSEWTSIEPYNQ